MKQIIPILKKQNNFLITSHVNPDPDALCSAMALALYLKVLGKNVMVVNQDEVLERYRFLPQLKDVKLSSKVKRAVWDVLIVLDSGDFERIGDVQQLVDKNTKILNIDHHVTNTRFADVNWVDEHASSTCEMIYELLRKLKTVLTLDQAILLYTGIMTDTGSFCYDNTSHRAHEISGKLLDYGFSANEIYRRIYETTPLMDMKLFSKVLSNFDLFFNDAVAFINLPKKIMDKFSGEFDVRDRIFDFFRSIKEIEAVVIFSEETHKCTRVNFRSKTRLNVAKIAEGLGGGGHRRASGCTMAGTIAQSREIVLKQIKKVV